jgi:hypothetical protein
MQVDYSDAGSTRKQASQRDVCSVSAIRDGICVMSAIAPCPHGMSHASLIVQFRASMLFQEIFRSLSTLLYDPTCTWERPDDLRCRPFRPAFRGAVLRE